MVRYCTFILLSMLISAPLSTLAQSMYKLKTVVLDAGHGGNQPGTVWGKYKEKDITLSVTKMLGELINKSYPDIKVIYTRTTDIAVDLYKRGEIANNAHADLFISIHVNASKSTSASGTETFVMGAGKSQQNLDVAMAENSVISYERDHHTKYEGFDPGSAESYIIFSLMQYSYLEQSLQFASAVQREFTSNTPMNNRGVKQAGFLVLWNTAMPSVLTEIGFLSNSKDRDYLTSTKGQQTVAQSLFKAFTNYKKEVEGNSSSMLSEAPYQQDIERVPSKSEVKQQTKQEARESKQIGEIFYTIQIKSATKKITINSTNFGDLAPKVWCEKIGGRYKYFVEKVYSYKDALSLQSSIRLSGIRDAFTVAFNGEKQISVGDAKKITDSSSK